MKPIPLVRFDAFANYVRDPNVRFSAEEMSWFEHGDERVLGLVIRDRSDNDFGGIVFGKDRLGRFRWIGSAGFHKTQRIAEVELRREMERLSAQPDEDYFQGDEAGEPINFFNLLGSEERAHLSFKALRDAEQYSAAREIIEPMMRWYKDADGNFIEQFQTTGFDARIWELYLFATFSELGFVISRIHEVPDFCCEGPLGDFNVEAVTLNPSRDKEGKELPPQPLDTPEQIKTYVNDYMPIRFASSLKSKLGKQYWDKPHVSDKPLIFAIADFSSPGSMIYSKSAFERYIYGYEHDWEHDEAGNLIIKPNKITSHRWNEIEIPSGFFELPEAEHVSAVLFSNSGTISKFNRMGVLAGFGSERIRLLRTGTAVNHDPNADAPLAFKHNVNAPDYCEEWREGIDIWHNPNALHPLDPNLLPGVAHHKLLPDGNVVSIIPQWHPLASVTFHSLTA